MNRRGFLGTLFGLAAAPVLSRLAFDVPSTAGLLSVAQPIILPTLSGTGEVLELSLSGMGQESAASFIRFLRGSGESIIHLSVNAMGGYCVQQFRTPVVFTPNHSLVVDAPANIDVRMTYRLTTGDVRCLRISNGVRTDLSHFASA